MSKTYLYCYGVKDRASSDINSQTVYKQLMALYSGYELYYDLETFRIAERKELEALINKCEAGDTIIFGNIQSLKRGNYSKMPQYFMSIFEKGINVQSINFSGPFIELDTDFSTIDLYGNSLIDSQTTSNNYNYITSYIKRFNELDVTDMKKEKKHKLYDPLIFKNQSEYNLFEKLQSVYIKYELNLIEYDEAYEFVKDNYGISSNNTFYRFLDIFDKFVVSTGRLSDYPFINLEIETGVLDFKLLCDLSNTQMRRKIPDIDYKKIKALLDDKGVSLNWGSENEYYVFEKQFHEILKSENLNIFISGLIFKRYYLRFMKSRKK